MEQIVDKVYKVRNKNNGNYLHAKRKYSKEPNWTDLLKSKSYTQIGHAKNAITNLVEVYKVKREKLEIVSFEIVLREIK